MHRLKVLFGAYFTRHKLNPKPHLWQKKGNYKLIQSNTYEFNKKIIGLLGLLLSLWATQAQAPIIQNIPEHIIVSGNSVMAVADTSNPLKVVVKPVLASIMPVQKSPAEQLDCLMRKESQGNPYAHNPYDTDGKQKWGCFQYDTDTFYEWCVLKYGMPYEIFNCELQRKCAYKMIFEDGQSWRWPPAKLCGIK
jgi:hypothetical protein